MICKSDLRSNVNDADTASFYDYETFQPLRGHGERVAFDNVNFTQIPMHIKGGSIIPLRVESANTTTELRKNDFKLLIAPGLDGTASGSLYLDDGESLIQDGITDIEFRYSADGIFVMNGTFEYDSGVSIESIVLLGQQSEPSGLGEKADYDAGSGAVVHKVDLMMTKAASMQLLSA